MSNNLRQASLATNAAVDAVTALLNGGRLQLYDGAQPASADSLVPPRSVLLAECAFGSPAFYAAKRGSAEAQPLEDTRVIATGSPTWFRAVTRSGRAVLDGSVGPTGTHADLELSVATLQIGAELVISGMTYTQPASL